MNGDGSPEGRRLLYVVEFKKSTYSQELYLQCLLFLLEAFKFFTPYPVVFKFLCDCFEVGICHCRWTSAILTSKILYYIITAIVTASDV